MGDLFRRRSRNRVFRTFKREIVKGCQEFCQRFKTHRFEAHAYPDEPTSERFLQRLGLRYLESTEVSKVFVHEPKFDAPATPKKAPAPFVVFGLPRSRTAWLSVFLTHKDWVCGHDLIAEINSASDLRQMLEQPNTGTVETGIGYAWPLIRYWFPEARFAVIRRPLAEVRASLLNQGLTLERLENDEATLDQIAALPGTLSVTFAELNTETGCRRLFEHCLGTPMDTGWWSGLAEQNIQIDFARRKTEMTLHRERVIGVARELHGLMSEVIFAVERWDDVTPECLPLLQAHHDEVGANLGQPYDLDIPTITALDRTGQLAIFTARLLGKLVGYLAFIITPNLESRGLRIGFRNTFYVMPQHRGFGLRLHRFAIDELRRRGIKHFSLRVGTRGSGPKLKSLYRRLGAKPDGELYNLIVD